MAQGAEPKPLELSRYCVPFTPFQGKLEDASICIVSTAAVRHKDDKPFDTEGDITWRVIGTDAEAKDLRYDDSHYDHACVDRDLNCVFPIDRVRELAARAARERAHRASLLARLQPGAARAAREDHPRARARGGPRAPGRGAPHRRLTALSPHGGHRAAGDRDGGHPDGGRDRRARGDAAGAAAAGALPARLRRRPLARAPRRRGPAEVDPDGRARAARRRAAARARWWSATTRAVRSPGARRAPLARAGGAPSSRLQRAPVSLVHGPS